MFSKIKRFFDPDPTSATRGNDRDEERKQLLTEVSRLQKENAELSEQLKRLSSHEDVHHHIHIEFFLYDAKNHDQTSYSAEDIHRFPMMGFTFHFLDEQSQKHRPEWLTYVLKGLENTFEMLKVHTHRVEEREVYSLFVDLKLYPHIEVKKCIYLVFQQLYQWQQQQADRVSLRIHIGGDHLYQQLLESHAETAS
ncbi:hypothetical protein GCM10011571_17660 [Marinithermofilum abyssi]|uniref:Uncharacterized protein n=1 Tax=Marinithermofilum abyssi TaxID=1571185 RepID=A0A8J2VBY0_9BACL|nr:hypothetical protein [Marinithermofilum abyssi]GGE16420.1 hypothetical protein GCM10011571_17660 [Marinithermofilum abyssi]